MAQTLDLHIQSFLDHLAATRATNTSQSLENGRAVASCIERVAALFPGRARCLEQSLTLFLILRRMGLPAELKLGAQALPFTAHAWVELFGEPLNGNAEEIRLLAPFPELPA